MLQVHDLRETRVYQEAKEEGRQEGRQEGIAHAIYRLAASAIPAEKIATTLEVDLETVHQALKSRSNGST